MIYGRVIQASRSDLVRDDLSEYLAAVQCGAYWMCKLTERRYTMAWRAHHADAVTDKQDS